ncbi:polyprenol monophosphomannose synthase [uncultured Amnibacterium sp.]|uniref:polyprenol monophosphomannose synthase n=1 Tax=uncultured Amnibacterium sp. TaxID=1631851 RepID=UPI0035CA4B31
MHPVAPTVIVIPTYDERENIAAAVASVHEHLPDAHVLVVDDASPDGTGVLADALAKADERVHVLHREQKDGLGGAYLAGFAWALERRYEVVGEFDADGSHPASALPAMRDALLRSPGIGLSIGSRWVRGGRVIDWPKSREALSRAGNTYARLMLALDVHDATAGFRLYRAELLELLDLATVVSKGYCFQVDLTVRAVATGYRIVEVPIEFRERTLGTSKMSRSIVIEAMGVVTVWGAARIFGRPGRWLAARLGTPAIPRRSQYAPAR